MKNLDDSLTRERAALGWVERLLDEPTQETLNAFDALRQEDPWTHSRVLAVLAMDDSEASLRTGGAWERFEKDLAPSHIGDYEIVRELGRGGMGVVYLATKQSDDFALDVAIKVVRTQIQSERLIERLRSERRAMTLLQHPNIAQIFDGGETQSGDPCLLYTSPSPRDLSTSRMPSSA